MHIRIGLFLFVMMFVSSTFSQTDYKKGTVNKDGFCTIYISDYKTSSSGSSAYETRYGLLNVKKNKIVLPIIYKNIFNTYEEGLYIVSDTLDNHNFGFNLPNKKLVKNSMAYLSKSPIVFGRSKI